MLSTRLVRLIESHAEELTRDLIQQLKTHPRTPAFSGLPETEVQERTSRVYRNLGAWLEGSREDMRRHYEEVGADECSKGVPLPEVIYSLVLSKKNLFRYVRAHGWEGTTLDIFGEQELVNRIDQFYDDAMYYAAVGYERVLRPEAGARVAKRA